MHQHIGIYGFIRPDIAKLADDIAQALEDYGVSCYCLAEQPFSRQIIKPLEEEAFLQTIDLLLVLGGDGTFLRAASLVEEKKIPLVGINKGHLGFLSELEVDEFFAALEAILHKKYTCETRLRIAAEVYRNNSCIGRATGLNDITINRHPMDNTLRLEAYIGDELIDRYLGDGLILATPTGSTGYSLSAGGPLIYPGTDCFIVTPLSPHSLTTRPAIIPPKANLSVRLLRAYQGASLFADGRHVMDLEVGDQLRILPAEAAVPLIHLHAHPFFTAVRNKLILNQYDKELFSTNKVGGENHEK